MSKTRIAIILLLGVTLAMTISAGLLWATASSGTTSTLLGRGTFDAFHVNREAAGLHVEVEAQTGLDIATQMITFKPGGNSGWHSHPGPVFITVISGTITFYDSADPTCSPVVVTAGQGFVDVGEQAHIAVNQSGAQAITVVTYLLPVGAPALRINQDQPSNCPAF
jgi:hypothetical protein